MNDLVIERTGDDLADIAAVKSALAHAIATEANAMVDGGDYERGRYQVQVEFSFTHRAQYKAMPADERAKNLRELEEVVQELLTGYFANPLVTGAYAEAHATYHPTA